MPAFWWHYNKIETKRQGRNVLTIHYEGRCILVYHVVNSGVPEQTRDRKTQPHCVVAGRGIVTIVNGRAIITPEKPKAPKKTTKPRSVKSKKSGPKTRKS